MDSSYRTPFQNYLCQTDSPALWTKSPVAYQHLLVLCKTAEYVPSFMKQHNSALHTILTQPSRTTPAPKEPTCSLPSGTSVGYLKLCAAQSWGQHSSALGEQWLHWNTQSHAGSWCLQEQGIFWKSMRNGESGGDKSFSLRETAQICCKLQKCIFLIHYWKNLWKTRWTALKWTFMQRSVIINTISNGFSIELQLGHWQIQK